MVPSPLKDWLLSNSIGRQISFVVASGCIVGLIAILKGEGLSLDAALALSGLIVAAILLDVIRAISRRDPEYGLPLVWKATFVVLAMMVAGIVVTVFLVLQKTDSVSELWSLLSKAGTTELLASTIFRRTDPKG
jgi:O-antigen ligase